MNVPKVDDVDRIADLNDPIVRNLQITQCYYEISQSVARFAGPSANMDRKTLGDQPPKLLVTINTAELAEIVENALQRALSKKPPDKVWFTLSEAAARLNCKASWLAARVKDGTVPHCRPGHRIYFTEENIAGIVKAGVKQLKVGGNST